MVRFLMAVLAMAVAVPASAGLWCKNSNGETFVYKIGDARTAAGAAFAAAWAGVAGGAGWAQAPRLIAPSSAVTRIRIMRGYRHRW